MILMPETEAALMRVAANQQHTFGFHEGAEIVAGGIGLDVGEEAFDPELHDAGDINPLSIWEGVTGEPHVDIVIPERPLLLQVILHQRKSNQADFYDIQAAKRSLAEVAHEIIGESLPGMTDMLRSYEVGEAAQAEAPAHVEAIQTNGDPLVEAKTIAELCNNGLSIVISDFMNLPLAQQDKRQFPATVAIKANHPFDLAYPAGVGRLPTANGGEIDTDKPRKLDPFNAGLTEAHIRTIAGLQQAGIPVAQIVFNRRDFPVIGFDPQAADSQLAAALDKLEQ